MINYTKEVPKEEGFYWYCNFGEHTPVLLKVERHYTSKKLYASDFHEEFQFIVEEPKESLFSDDDLRDPDDEPRFVSKNGTKYYYGDEVWAKIPDGSLHDVLLEESSF